MTAMELAPGSVRRAFDRAAAGYDRHAALQQEVERRLLERVDYFELSPAAVLDLGCGTGSGSQALSQRFPEAQVVGLDLSPGMLARLQVRNGPQPLCADFLRLPLTERCFDLAFSNLALPWCMDLSRALLETRRVLRPGGLFLFTTFGPGTLAELREAWARADALPHVNDFADMHDIGDLLVAAGFRDPVMDVERLVLEYRDILQLMRELKATGSQKCRHRPGPGADRPRKIRAAHRGSPDGCRVRRHVRSRVRRRLRPARGPAGTHG